jgi:hypothetical protein
MNFSSLLSFSPNLQRFFLQTPLIKEKFFVFLITYFSSIIRKNYLHNRIPLPTSQIPENRETPQRNK